MGSAGVVGLALVGFLGNKQVMTQQGGLLCVSTRAEVAGAFIYLAFVLRACVQNFEQPNFTVG